MGEGPGGLEGKGCRRSRQALGRRKERAASGCARPAACLGCRTLTARGASHGPEAGLARRGGLPRFVAPEAAAGGGAQGRAGPARVILPRGGAGSPWGARPSPRRRASARARYVALDSAQTRSPRAAGSAGVLHCSRLAIFMSP